MTAEEAIAFCVRRWTLEEDVNLLLVGQKIVSAWSNFRISKDMASKIFDRASKLAMKKQQAALSALEHKLQLIELLNKPRQQSTSINFQPFEYFQRLREDGENLRLLILDALRKNTQKGRSVYFPRNENRRNSGDHHDTFMETVVIYPASEPTKRFEVLLRWDQATAGNDYGQEYPSSIYINNSTALSFGNREIIREVVNPFVSCLLSGIGSPLALPALDSEVPTHQQTIYVFANILYVLFSIDKVIYDFPLLRSDMDMPADLE